MILYTKDVCPKCMLVKSVLEATGLTYTVKNLDEDDDAKNYILENGFMSVPILEVNGELIGEVIQIQQKISELVE